MSKLHITEVTQLARAAKNAEIRALRQVSGVSVAAFSICVAAGGIGSVVTNQPWPILAGIAAGHPRNHLK